MTKRELVLMFGLSISLTALVLVYGPNHDNGVTRVTVQNWHWADELCAKNGGVQHLLKPDSGEGLIAVCEDGKLIR